MLFNSIEFIIFLPFIVILYYLIPHKFRWVMLLISSYIFYMVWNPIYVVLILTSTIVDYISSILMEKQELKRKRKAYLFVSLFINLGLLTLFKYFDFFNDVTGIFMERILNRPYSFSGLGLLLPMGISFYTFQTLSYTIDVYKGTRKAEKHLGYFALYVTYFPQLVAGPIERSDKLLPQLKQKHHFNYENTVEALLMITWGFFKKIVIADRAAVIANSVYGDLSSYRGIYLIIATISFAIQIYCDFSAYSDIAIGSAKLMGVELIQNFKMPYFSTSVTEFWRRWHISLSQWFRDYLYFPLGGNRKGGFRTYINVMIVFVVSGFWHGANFTFLVWGFLHGLFQIIERFVVSFKRKSSRKSLLNVPTIFKQILTFNLVLLGWVFFRSETINDAFYVMKNVSLNNIYIMFDGSLFGLGLDIKDFGMLIFTVLFLFLIEGIQYNQARDKLISGDFLQGLCVVILILFIVIFGYYGEYDPTQFIYFQF